MLKELFEQLDSFLLFTQCFNQYILQSSSGVLYNSVKKRDQKILVLVFFFRAQTRNGIFLMELFSDHFTELYFASLVSV